MISDLKRARDPVTHEPLSHNDKVAALYDALEAATTAQIDTQCELLRNDIKRRTTSSQKIGINTAREILAAIGELMNNRDPLPAGTTLRVETSTTYDAPTTVMRVPEPWHTLTDTEG
jgi:hypothetical protein